MGKLIKVHGAKSGEPRIINTDVIEEAMPRDGYTIMSLRRHASPAYSFAIRETIDEILAMANAGAVWDIGPVPYSEALYQHLTEGTFPPRPKPETPPPGPEVEYR